MAIKFDVEESKKQQEELQEQENKLAKEENRKAKKIKIKVKKNAFEKWSNLLLTLSIIAVLYAISYVISGFIVLIPTLFLYFIWLIVVLFATVFTVGLVWLSAGFRSFIGGFANFNASVGEHSVAIMEFMYKIFPYLASFFAFIVIGYLILKVVGAKKQIGKSYKSKLVWSIILTVLFVALIVFDIIAFIKVV